jgi:hypothetical protein
VREHSEWVALRLAASEYVGSRLWLPWPHRERGALDMIEISDEYMITTVDGEIVATARWSWYATADGRGA